MNARVACWAPRLPPETAASQKVAVVLCSGVENRQRGRLRY